MESIFLRVVRNIWGVDAVERKELSSRGANGEKGVCSICGQGSSLIRTRLCISCYHCLRSFTGSKMEDLWGGLDDVYAFASGRP